MFTQKIIMVGPELLHTWEFGDPQQPFTTTAVMPSNMAFHIRDSLVVF